jgi:hypothetical protein
MLTVLAVRFVSTIATFWIEMLLAIILPINSTHKVSMYNLFIKGKFGECE